MRLAWRGGKADRRDQVRCRKAAGATQEQVDAAATMNAGDEQAMIRGMVDGLAAKLESDPKNMDGWLRLIRARIVLKEADAAQAALTRPAAFLMEIKVRLPSFRQWRRKQASNDTQTDTYRHHPRFSCRSLGVAAGLILYAIRDTIGVFLHAK